MKTTMYKMLLFGLLFCCATGQSLAQCLPDDWGGLRTKTLTLGLRENCVDHVLDQCRRNGISATDTERLLRPVYTAHEEQLPADFVFSKIEEGLAKQVDTKRLTVAVNTRLTCLREAKQLTSSSNPRRGGRGSGASQHLMTRTCSALESGLPADVLLSLFSRPSGFRYGRITHVIEAGEILHLEGLAPEQIQSVLNDCLDRDLNGSETSRVTEVILKGMRNQQPFETIYAGLWVQADNPE